MTKTEQDRLNAAVKAQVEESNGYWFTEAQRELKNAAQPLLEKEPRTFIQPIENGDTIENVHTIELTDTPYIVQKGKKPIKLTGGYAVTHTVSGKVRVDCDD